MIGLSSYAFFWRSSDRVPEPLGIEDMVRETAALGVGLLQLCDVPVIEEFDAERLESLRALAAAEGVALELGTRGTDPEHLRRYLRLAAALDVTLLRSMWTSGEDRPDREETLRRLREIAPALETAGVTLALETYEQVATAALVDVIETLDDPRIRICLDPANTVANLELPADVTALCAPYVANWHVKDFDFSRNPGWVGFVYTGTALGDGRLDYDGMLALLDPDARGIHQIIEFWLPWQDTVPAADQALVTTRLEAEWTATTLAHLRRRNP
ncbi:MULTISPECIES: sugar phosphate isomerase/epimerase family protein [unclassified Rathayibacter]|uniref:sugar phosphate isomerase/epimerase family protein n=1 Tax=unclassified Rathayibacter TaxID=2609250 RepID=UPI0006F61D69|nr:MULTISPECIES: sugar phosphate isomerase/epimerase family protein [unclassified Rathayibacter]KQQ01562.1 sugar phosphate isomerase [Rathayibacter sp. Leaf294]KQS11594.1 sugar phosphate isomerase [Rathayibacter sp. Leaf185]